MKLYYHNFQFQNSQFFFIAFNVAVTVIEISRPNGAIKNSKIWYAIKRIRFDIANRYDSDITISRDVIVDKIHRKT